jgi:hypothetical protein
VILEAPLDAPFGDFDLSSIASIVEIDHQQGAVDRLVIQFQKPRIQALVRRLTATMQDFETAAIELLRMRRVELATGDLLDKFGAMVGQPRGDLDDETYRRYIRATIRAHRSHGLPVDLTEIGHLIVADDAAIFVMTNWGGGVVTIEITQVLVDFEVAAVLMQFLQRAVAAGVRLYLEWIQSAPEDAFTFEGFVPGTETGEGFLTFDETDGGALGSVLVGA